jgi:hypothetical protein
MVNYTRVYHHLLAILGDGVKGCTCSLEKRIEMTKLHMAATGGTIIAEVEEDNSAIFLKKRVLGSMESSQGATNDHDQVDSIGSSSNIISRRKVVMIEMSNVGRFSRQECACH